MKHRSNLAQAMRMGDRMIVVEENRSRCRLPQMIRLAACLLLFAVPNLADAQVPTTTNVPYNFPRNFSNLVINAQPTLSSVMMNGMRLTGIVGPFEVQLQTNACFLRQYESIALGYATVADAQAAVNAAIDATLWRTNSSVIYTNTGWVRGAQDTAQGARAYLWILQNETAFKTSPSNVWVSNFGVTSHVAKVLVGTIGDYPPNTFVTSVGPTCPVGSLSWTNTVTTPFTEEVTCVPDFTAYYRILKVELDVDSSDAQNTCKLDEENGRSQFATVKGAGNVVLRATLQPDTPEIRAMIDWQGATKDPLDPTTATIPRTAATKQEVDVLLNGAPCQNADVWVVWAAIDQLITSNPPGTPVDSDVSPTTHTCGTGYFDYGLYYNPPDHFQNGILIGAKIYPPMFSNRNNQVHFNFKRTRESVTWIEWDNTGWQRNSYHPPGSDDSPTDCSQDLIPSVFDNVYDVDGPGRNGMAHLWKNWVYQGSFEQWLEIELPGFDSVRCSDKQPWHAELWIKRHWLTGSFYRHNVGNTIGGGAITINSTTHP